VRLPSSAPKPQDVTIPKEKPELRDIVVKPSATEVKSPLLEEKPESKPINLDQLMKTDAVSAGSAEKELGSIASAFLKDSVKAPRQPVINMPANKGKDGGDAWEGIPGRRSLDDALSRTGPLPRVERRSPCRAGRFSIMIARSFAETRSMTCRSSAN